jgi:hypothetical protein
MTGSSSIRPTYAVRISLRQSAITHLAAVLLLEQVYHPRLWRWEHYWVRTLKHQDREDAEEPRPMRFAGPP